MNEADVTLTDYALAIECLIFSFLMIKTHSTLGKCFSIFFFSIALAALIGGTVHGFFYKPETFTHQVLWRLSLISIGLIAFSGWTIGLSLLPIQESTKKLIQAFLILEFVAYIFYVVLISDNFIVAMINYLPAAVFLLGVFIHHYLITREIKIVYGILALILTMIAAIVQQAKIGVHSEYFDHNALYHLIQFVAFYLLFISAVHLIDYKKKL